MEKLSKTCPHCGKLNSIHETNCTNCGAPLPQSGEKIIGYTQPKSKRSVAVTFILLAIVLITGVVAISIKQNQEILRTSSVNVVPFKIKFFNQHNRLVMVRYIKGKSRTSKNGYATGTMVVTKQLKATHSDVVSYEDSRAKKRW
ncbi:zinc ribbon domain-containing protein [Limosilactobacillus caecicola]|uniref:zinc ribbon domain-containing protein n=1 Tax=Limosilactobacillus caecicola TaxID=2941332 RepID=UPI00203D1809|nr:zinc ribbon domain-containing protein [Limosilactobacillus caecicola]